MMNIRHKAAIAALGLPLMAVPAAAAHAPQPPRPGCVAASKIEYNSAIRSKTQGRFGTYVRTRSLLRRTYWYCPL
jgi:hypothetical protein